MNEEEGTGKEKMKESRGRGWEGEGVRGRKCEKAESSESTS